MQAMNVNTKWTPMEIGPETSAGSGGTAEALQRRIDEIPDLEALLDEEKAIVFRGFQIAKDQLAPIMNRLLPERLAYVHGNSPRTKVGDNVYTSTEYPAAFTISMHNELSYSYRWPSRLMFCCLEAAETGGATPVVDGSRWLDSLNDGIRERFDDGIRYTQNLHDGVGFGKSWQDTFETDDRDLVDSFLADPHTAAEWQLDGSLRITQRRPATIRHPRTGTEVWFNQADQWHPATLGDEVAAELAELLPPEELPQSVAFADGGPIPLEDVRQIRDCGLAAAVDVTWREGDVLLIDNVLVGHGRRPFTGSRRVLVAMSG
jgi:alpha-ketoglutarate-dependent taurine dioxygenase